MVTSVLFGWSLAQLHVLAVAMTAALTACPGGAGTPQLPLALPVALIRRHDMPLMPLAVALETLTLDLQQAVARGAGVRADEREELVTVARAWFLVLFSLDFRVRRLVCAPGAATHGVFGTRPPPRAALARFFGGARPEGSAQQYLDDMAGCSPHNDLAYAREQTYHLVAFMSSWWACGAPVPPLDWDRTLGGVRPPLLGAQKRKRSDRDDPDADTDHSVTVGSSGDNSVYPPPPPPPRQ